MVFMYLLHTNEFSQHPPSYSKFAYYNKKWLTNGDIASFTARVPQENETSRLGNGQFYITVMKRHQAYTVA